MKFKVGQRVGYLYEKGYGVIQQLDKQYAVVTDEDGFDRKINIGELVFIHGENYDQKIKADSSMIGDDPINEDKDSVRKFEVRTGQKTADKIWEMDLHIEELIDSHVGLSNTEIMMRQLSSFRQIFKQAQKENIAKLIVIHGVGEGVLKNEVRMYLEKQEQIEFYDADYSVYGKGATEIVFHPNWK